MIKLKTMAMEVAIKSFFHKKIIHEDNTYEIIAWKNSRHFAMSPLVFPRNNVWETSAEIA